MTALKTDIATAIEHLGIRDRESIRVGDDAAAIPRGDGYDLLACEGMDSNFVSRMPWFAGWSSVMVNISDIAAMGGKPRALVNATWSTSETNAAEVFAGMRAACEAFDVPMVGGHTNLQSNTDQLAVAVLGYADKLLTSFDAKPGQQLMMAVDLRGEWQGDYPFWNAATKSSPDQLRRCLGVLPRIADQQLATSAKDISQAGTIGTATMLAETSRVGIEIDLDKIPTPPDLPDTKSSFERWLKAFPSFGYLLSVDTDNVSSVRELFSEVGVTSAVIGSINYSCEVTIRRAGDVSLVRNLGSNPLTGC